MGGENRLLGAPRVPNFRLDRRVKDRLSSFLHQWEGIIET